jgi:sigma-E factor negative regulatory protein RseB
MNLRARWMSTALSVVALLAAGHAVADEPRDWLRRMNEALAGRNYDGSFFHMAGGKVESLRIIHRVSGGKVTERLVSLDGSGREFIRTGGELACYLPDQRMVLVERRMREGALLGKLPAFDDSNDSYYEVGGGHRARLMGRPVRVVVVTPRDEYRYGYRLWIDEKTAMPLKTQLCDGRGNVIEQILFASLTLPRAIPDAAFSPAISGEGFRWVRRESRFTDPSDSSPLAWRAIRLPPGFRLRSRGQQVIPGAPGETAHVVYSDGVAAVSVFVGPRAGQGAAPPAQGAVRMGSSATYSTVVDGHPVTVVGEVPEQTVQFIASQVRPQAAVAAQGGANGPRH